MPPPSRPMMLVALVALAGGCRPAAAPGPAAPAAIAQRPADPKTMRSGRLYAGALPRPAPAAPSPQLRYPAIPALSETPSPPPGPDRDGWNDLVRYLARHAAAAGDDGVLLAPGSTLAAPRRVACAGKPRAVLVDVAAVLDASGRRAAKPAVTALAAAETLGLTIVYTIAPATPRRPDLVAALAAAGLARPVPGRTLLAMAPGREPATRAAAGRSYCVVALAGDRASDFPAGALAERGRSGWPDGWFLMPAAGG